MSDIAKRLRHIYAVGTASADNEDYCTMATLKDIREAAEEIEGLEAEDRNIREQWKECEGLRELAVEELSELRGMEAEAHAEVERLRDEAIHNEGVMVALKEGYEERGAEIEKLKAENPVPGMWSIPVVTGDEDE